MVRKIYTDTREEWLALRRGYIGGSDAAAVVGLSPFSSPYQVWAEKTGKIPPFEGNLATQVGTYLEDFVARLWSDETGRKVQRDNASLINDAYPWAIADIDRRVVGVNEGLEIKTTNSLAMKHFANGEFPAQYYVQCMHYMAVLGPEWKRWHLAVLIGNSEFKTFVIDRDEDEIAALMEAERAMMERIQNDEPPEAQDGDGATLERMFPQEQKGLEVDLTPVMDAIREYCDFKSRIREFERLKNDAASRIKEYMKDAEFGVTGDGYKVSWRQQSSGSFDAEMFAKLHKNIDIRDCYKYSVSRILRVNEPKKNI